MPDAPSSPQHRDTLKTAVLNLEMPGLVMLCVPARHLEGTRPSAEN